MPREIIPPIIDEGDDRFGAAERHPAFGMIGASRVSAGGKGAVLFDSEIRHQHYVTVSIRGASRRRHLNRDWIHAENEIVEVAMSEAQWASFVSSMNAGDGVSCTIERREGRTVPGFPHEPRMRQSMDEVHEAADKALKRIREAFKLVQEKPTKANIRNMAIVLENAPRNMEFAAESLTEHAENVVQKARADVEAMVIAKAEQLGLDPAELGTLQLTEGGEAC